jgi:copper transport protein
MTGVVPRRWPYVLLLMMVVAATLVPVGTREAEAHAALVRANPANNETLRRAPTRVVLNFSEPLERELTKIEVVDRDDERVDEGDTAFDDADPAFASVGLQDLEPGLYYVRWSNVSSVDGHGLQGSYPFAG